MNRRPHPYQGCALPTELPQHQTQTAIISLNSPDMVNLSPSFLLNSKADIVISNFFRNLKSGERGSNPQHPAWKASTLPIELSPQTFS